MAQQPSIKFNSNSKGFSLGWDASDTKTNINRPLHSAKIQLAQTPGNRSTRFLHKKPDDLFSKVGAANSQLYTPQKTPKITRNDKEKSQFFFGDIPASEQRTLKIRERTEKEIEEDGIKFDEAKKLKQKAKKQEIQRMHNSKICKIQEQSKKRQTFRF